MPLAPGAEPLDSPIPVAPGCQVLRSASGSERSRSRSASSRWRSSLLRCRSSSKGRRASRSAASRSTASSSSPSISQRARSRSARSPRQVAGAGQQQRVASSSLAHRGEEGAGALLGGGEEEQRRAEAVALAPGFGLDVLRVARRLLLEAAVGHRPHVQLDEGEQAPALASAISMKASGAIARFSPRPESERLAGIRLALEADELRPRRAASSPTRRRSR